MCLNFVSALFELSSVPILILMCFNFVSALFELSSVPILLLMCFNFVIKCSYTVSHFSFALLFQGPHFVYRNAGIEHSV